LEERRPRPLREVVFVDGVRTPFGKAGPKGIYAETRADDLVVRVIRELLRRNPALPADRVDEVAIAATTQVGDQGLTLGRTAALLAGLPRSVPGYSVDRMCAGAMTAVTTTASGIAFGAYDVAIAGGVEHMGRHPMARAPIRTRGSSARSWSTARRWSWAPPPRTCTTASRT
jgi:Acetyl-CoA acetyltransferase